MTRTGEKESLRLFLAERDAACPECGYNVRGLAADACPECHRRLELEIARIPRPSRRRWRLLLLLAALGAVRAPVGLWQVGYQIVMGRLGGLGLVVLVTTCIWAVMYLLLGLLCVGALVQLLRTKDSDRSLAICDGFTYRLLGFMLATWVVSLLSQTLGVLGLR